MIHPEPDVLAGLALRSSEVDPAVRAHVAGCAACSGLVERLAGVRRTAAASDELVAPPDAVRHRVLAEISAAGPAVATPHQHRPHRHRLRHRRAISPWLAGAAAAAALVAGLGLGRLTAVDPTPPDSPGAVVAAAELTALDSDAPRGVADAVRSDGAIILRVSARALGDEDGFHEVWLINLDDTRMVALGVLADGDVGEFEVPQGLIDEGYRTVDISVEPEDGDPTHSGVSLARGELT